MHVEILNRELFISLISIFRNKKHISITISSENIFIECIEIHKYYLNIPNTIFKCEGEMNKITVIPVYLYEALKSIKTCFLEVNKDYIKIYNTFSYIKIPLMSTINYEYEDIEDVYTKLVVDSKVLKVFNKLKGLVKYEIENDTLFLRKLAVEEIEIRDFKFMEAGELSFLCNNDWSETINEVCTYVESAMFLFSLHLCSVLFLFKKDEKIYFEIQIPRSLVEV